MFFERQKKRKEQHEKHRKRMSDSLLQKNLKKIAPYPSLVPAPYFPHFQSVLSDLKLDGCTNQGFTKTSFYSRGKDATIKQMLQMFFELQNQRNNVLQFDLFFEFFKCLLTSLSTLPQNLMLNLFFIAPVECSTSTTKSQCGIPSINNWLSWGSSTIDLIPHG